MRLPNASLTSKGRITCTTSTTGGVTTRSVLSASTLALHTTHSYWSIPLRRSVAPTCVTIVCKCSRFALLLSKLGSLKGTSSVSTRAHRTDTLSHCVHLTVVTTSKDTGKGAGEEQLAKSVQGTGHLHVVVACAKWVSASEAHCVAPGLW